MLNTNEKINWIKSLDLSNASVDIITKLIHERKVSCEELVYHYFDTIEKQQSLNAFISTDKASAIQQAQYWDKYLLSGKPCPALMGILIAVKDNIHVAGFPNSAGTPALAQFRPQTSAPVIQKLIEQGAIIVGKANMHELAFGVTGYNTAMHIEGVVGTRNAVNPLHIAGGSSSGSAVAVAAGMVPIAMGTDTGASIRLPSALNGCVGFRPTVGRYSQEGITPISHTRDTAGPIAHTVSDVILIDELITQEPRKEPLEPHQIRLGINSYFWNHLDEDVHEQAHIALELLKSAGVEIISVDMPNLEQLNQAVSFPVVIYEGKYDLIQYLKDHRIDLTLESVVDQISSPDVQAIFKLNILPELTLDPNGQLVPVLPLYEKAIREARPQLLELYQNTFKAHNLHALLFPTSPIVAPLANEQVYSIETFQTLMRNTDPGSNIGIPGLSLPIGKGAKSKLPVGLEIDGLAHQDSEILAIGITLEKIFKRLNQ
ncbi:indoleacetamide hydrolase [Acinetobacter sp. IK22]|uniref:indoleacetamide hydrolase n=1 Tax=unclassified Acinetobacter TaxID=196816 RepID=UPI002D1E6810|nr:MULTISPECIES: indoleacetamide hydrolase [unclassified Acinetobacter]MEB3796988.1 indoleacetamide hydrolase [Acinetobacter sp. IK24]MEB3816103.1 indoleacetamide hydrolase [Acinetobacter sp. IK22]MEB3835362.1 indoleacetamide hydrolase [Acinetobacter sp. IK23]